MLGQRHLPRHCTVSDHLTGPQPAACGRAPQLVLAYTGGTPAACRACAAMFALHQPYFLALPLGEPPATTTGRLALTGKRRSVYLHVLHQIYTGAWPPGHPVPGAVALGRACRCADSTAVAAVRAMEREGWLRYSGHIRRVIADPDQWPQPASRPQPPPTHERHP